MTKGCGDARRSKNRHELEKWIKNLQDQIKRLSKKLKMRFPINIVNAVSDTVQLLMRFELVLKKELPASTRVGEGVSNRVLRPRSRPPLVDIVSNDRLLSDRVQWRDLESAFQSRIRTGVVINLTHKDLNKFFDDAKQMFLSRVRNAFHNN